MTSKMQRGITRTDGCAAGYLLRWLIPVFGTLLVVISCASIQKGYVEYTTRGRIVDVHGSDVSVHVESTHTVVGQEYDVYKDVLVSRHRFHLAEKTKPERRLVGRIRITEVVNEHLSKARVVSGTAEKGDTVELVKPEKQ